MSDNDETIADLLAVVVSGRPDPLVDVGLADAPPAVKVELARVREALSGLALAESPVIPSPDLRSRMLRSLAERIAPRRAMLVVDMQNDHLMPGKPLEVPRARDIVPALAARLDSARRERVPIVYVVDEHEADDSDLDNWGTHNLKGTPGVGVWEPLAPKPGDRVVRKPTYSAFVRSNLAEVLAELRVDTLVLTGCATEVGLLATATDALQRGYAVEIPPDAQAGATAATEQVALGLVQLLAPYGRARQALLRQLG
ncbi:MAG TPA: isochorismatase family cysteine hydrolase [Polyangiaceae bacterium]|nr:isochorismatase family cysteine hydrolase [Polyangiaceae bacterium]